MSKLPGLSVAIAAVALLVSTAASGMAGAASDSEWSVPLRAEAGVEGSNADLEFGICPGGTDGCDSGIDLLSPPPAPGAPFEAYFSIVHNLFPRLTKDFRGDMPKAWTLKVSATDEDIELSWNTDRVPHGVALRLVSAEAEINMKAVSRVTLPAGAHTITITAEQVETDQHSLALSSTDGGSVIVPGEGAFAYDKGAVVGLVAEAEEGYRFAGWTGDVDTIANVNAASSTITMSDDYEITANFEEVLSPPPPPGVHGLAISSTEGGSVSSPGEGSFAYEGETVVNLVASRDSGYVFVRWTGDVDTIDNVNAASTTITMNGSYSIKAHFEKDPEVFASELVSWWRAEGDATDAWGDNHGVLMNGAAFGEGKVGQAFRLDGVDDWVMVPSAPTLNFGTEDFTVCLWVSFTDPDPEQVMIEKYVETFGSPERIGWTFTKLDSTMVRLHLGPGHWSVVDAPASITANTWHFAAVSRSGNTYRVYWDGNLIGSSSWEDNFNLHSDASLKIGHRGDPDDTPGSEDDSGYYLAGLV